MILQSLDITKCDDTDAMERSGLLRHTSPIHTVDRNHFPPKYLYSTPIAHLGGEVLGVSSHLYLYHKLDIVTIYVTLCYDIMCYNDVPLYGYRTLLFVVF